MLKKKPLFIVKKTYNDNNNHNKNQTFIKFKNENVESENKKNLIEMKKKYFDFDFFFSLQFFELFQLAKEVRGRREVLSIGC